MYRISQMYMLKRKEQLLIVNLYQRFFHKCHHVSHLPSIIQLHTFLPNWYQVRNNYSQWMKAGQVRLLTEVFGCSYRKTYLIMCKHAELATLDEIQIQNVCEIFSEFGIRKEDTAEYPQVLSLSPAKIKNYAMLLQEGGFSTITLQQIVNYFTVVRKPVRVLKAYGFIPNDTCVHESILSFLDQPAPPYQSTDTKEISDDEKFSDVQVLVLNHYLRWRLEMSDEKLISVNKIYQQFRHRSIRLVERTLKILEGTIGFSKDKIQRHGFLIHCNPDNILDMLTRVKSVGGVDIIPLLLNTPKLVNIRTNSILKILQYLQEYNIPKEAVLKWPSVLALSSDTVLNRLEVLHTIPEFSSLVRHPLILKLVYYQHRVRIRLSYLQEMKIRCMSLHLLGTSQDHFERYIREGNYRTKGRDLIKFLSAELNVSEMKVKKSLRRHIFWCQVPLVNVKETFEFLLGKGFTREQIFFNIHVLLYSRTQLEKELNNLPSRQELQYAFWPNKQPLNMKAIHPRQIDRILPEKRLALCLYFIERDYHFTGDGIWSETAVSANTVTSESAT